MRKIIEGVVKAVDTKAKTVEAIISTINPDRSEEIVLPSSFTKHLPKYLANPLLLWGHAASQDDVVFPGPENCIGKALDVKIGEETVEAVFEYATKINNKASLVFDLVANGFLRSYSVGFLPFVYRWYDDDLSDLPLKVQSWMSNGKAWLCYTENELIETSQCFIGDNRESLVKAFRSGALNRKELDNLLTGKEIPKIHAVPELKINQTPSIDVESIATAVTNNVMAALEAKEMQKSIDAAAARLSRFIK